MCKRPHNARSILSQHFPLLSFSQALSLSPSPFLSPLTLTLALARSPFLTLSSLSLSLSHRPHPLMSATDPVVEAHQLDGIPLESSGPDHAILSKDPEKCSASILRQSASSMKTAETEHLDSEAIQRLRAKVDWHLLPLVSVLYLCSFLDRVNIGKAPLLACAFVLCNELPVTLPNPQPSSHAQMFCF